MNETILQDLYVIVFKTVGTKALKQPLAFRAPDQAPPPRLPQGHWRWGPR
jgi:hypothetical protein